MDRIIEHLSMGEACGNRNALYHVMSLVGKSAVEAREDNNGKSVGRAVGGHSSGRGGRGRARADAKQAN